MTNSATELVNKPEEQHESLDKGPEVIMLVDGTFSVLFNRNVPKQLVKQKNEAKKNQNKKQHTPTLSFTVHSLKVLLYTH